MDGPVKGFAGRPMSGRLRCRPVRRTGRSGRLHATQHRTRPRELHALPATPRTDPRRCFAPVLRAVRFGCHAPQPAARGKSSVRPLIAGEPARAASPSGPSFCSARRTRSANTAQQIERQLGHVLHEFAQPFAREHQDAHRAHRDDRRAARGTVEHRHLAEIGAGSEPVQPHLVGRAGAAQHLDLAFHEAEEFVAQFALAHDDFAAHVLGFLRDALDRVQPFETHAREQRDLSQRQQSFHQDLLLCVRRIGRDARPWRRQRARAMLCIVQIARRRDVAAQRGELLVDRDRLEQQHELCATLSRSPSCDTTSSASRAHPARCAGAARAPALRTTCLVLEARERAPGEPQRARERVADRDRREARHGRAGRAQRAGAVQRCDRLAHARGVLDAQAAAS